jgi:hypothetical protein
MTFVNRQLGIIISTKINQPSPKLEKATTEYFGLYVYRIFIKCDAQPNTLIVVMFNYFNHKFKKK